MLAIWRWVDYRALAAQSVPPALDPAAASERAPRTARGHVVGEHAARPHRIPGACDTDECALRPGSRIVRPCSSRPRRARPPRPGRFKIITLGSLSPSYAVQGPQTRKFWPGPGYPGLRGGTTLRRGRGPCGARTTRQEHAPNAALNKVALLTPGAHKGGPTNLRNPTGRPYCVGPSRVDRGDNDPGSAESSSGNTRASLLLSTPRSC
jgi:hypothetical protein